MIRNETPLETIFNNMIDELQDDFLAGELCGKDGNYLELAGQINLGSVYCFMHNAPKADNPSGICQFMLSEQDYINENDESLPLTESHQKELQELCDMYAQDGFKFEVTLNPMSLLWTKDGKVIDRDNFDEINDRLYKDAIKLFPVKKTLDFYADPAHGWLKVPLKDLYQLGITGDISECSYEKGEFVYLEEDCDATLYLAAQRAQGFNIKENYHDSDRSSKIRSYNSYSLSNNKPFEKYDIKKKELFDKAKAIVDKLLESKVFVIDNNGKITYTNEQSSDDLKDIISKFQKEQYLEQHLEITEQIKENQTIRRR